MAQRIERLDRPRLYEQVVERIIGLVFEENLDIGDRLPPERELAEQLGVSRATVAQALVALEVLQVIEVHHGSGATLVHRPSSAVVVRGLREHASQLPDIVDARRAVETQLASLAAQRRSAEDVERIDAAVKRMRDDIAAGDRGLAGDELFHSAVTAAARSPLLAQMMDQIADLIRQTRIESLSQEGRPERSLECHTRIAQAIRDGDPQAAAQEMDDHIRLVSDLPLISGGVRWPRVRP